MKRKYIYLIFGIIFILHATIGGLFLPLAPNIEKIEILNYQDTFLQIKVWAPKTSNSNSEFFLVKNTFDSTQKVIIEAKSIEKQKQNILVKILNPSYCNLSQKGDLYDLWMQNPTDGAMVYFSAFTIDSMYKGISPKNIDKSKLMISKEFKWAFPNRPILRESIRNLFFHVPMWFGMMAMLIASLYYSIRYLSTGNLEADQNAKLTTEIGLLFGSIGILTGMIWANYTWGALWTDDAKLNGAAIGMLVYFAYTILRFSLPEPILRARLSAVYNIFAFNIYFVFVYILPRMKSSLHPGNGGNPGFNIYEQDNTMRLFFYPAVIGWILIGFYLKNWRAKKVN